MTKEEIIARQKEEKDKCIRKIIESSASKKIIVAGAGTGKTYTFKEILRHNSSGENIAMTFIRLLSNEMYNSLGNLAEVKTFHAYCKKVLHELNGRVDLFPILTQIIADDAKILGLNLSDFDNKFQMLDENSGELQFYLRRGNYYEAVSFNDAVYRLYKKLHNDASVIPTYNQILIDEFQDFNPLEVAFINELEKKGKILIVGDNDQDVYDSRGASSHYLREKFNSGSYEIFELPFCNRCPNVIVKATNSFILTAQTKGHLQGRIDKRYETFLELKDDDSTRFPTIITAQCTTGKTIPKYIDQVISNIETRDIEESWREGSEYPTVLIVGPKQHLTIIQNELINKYPQIKYKLPETVGSSIIDAYNILLDHYNHNFGWRLLIDFFLSEDEIAILIRSSENGKPLVELLSQSFLKQQNRVLDIIRIIRSGEGFTDVIRDELSKIVGEYTPTLIDNYTPKEKEEEPEPDKTQPSILLSSFVGCKGLSSSFTIIVGANNGSLPKNPRNILDVEISQFLVALTRTRKQCHIISNKWLIAPVLKNQRIPASRKTIFLEWIPSEFIQDKGDLKAKDIK